jgi:solute carrier family 25 phosphate transporter 23/24/25/41
LPLVVLPTQCGILPYAGVDICLFELFKDMLLERYDGEPPHVAIVGTGMASSSIAQFVSYPLALVRTRLQAQGVGGRPIKYSGMADVFTQTLAKEGPVGFYKVRCRLLLAALPVTK